MIINSNLFSECWCPCEGIARVCLSGSNGIPEDLEKIGKKIDGDEYDPSCFSIDVIVNDGDNLGATVNYMGINEFYTIGICDNVDDVMDYYMKHADKDSINETLGKEVN